MLIKTNFWRTIQIANWKFNMSMDMATASRRKDTSFFKIYECNNKSLSSEKRVYPQSRDNLGKNFSWNYICNSLK